MRATGIVRKIDELGRVVIPKELRTTFNIPEGTPLEIFTDNDNIILRKYEPGCVFCGGMEEIVTHKGKRVCFACRKQLG
jgi:transcriptional pleiotropic regulator of transition state genes